MNVEFFKEKYWFMQPSGLNACNTTFSDWIPLIFYNNVKHSMHHSSRETEINNPFRKKVILLFLNTEVNILFFCSLVCCSLSCKVVELPNSLSSFSFRITCFVFLLTFFMPLPLGQVVRTVCHSVYEMWKEAKNKINASKFGFE